MAKRWMVLGALLTALAGCGGGGGGGDGAAGGNRAPEIGDLQVSPAELRFNGGLVTVSTTATDPDGDAMAVSLVTQGTSLSEVSMMTGAESFSGQVVLPLNNTTEPRTYTLRVIAHDGTVASERSSQVTVGGVLAPVAPPL